ncbi:hypothetical protein HKD21_00840 [Gluconobacter cerevisiae]|uniref:Alpha/beta hydrolase n=1 Tax=Gluconobacter cerevisiae TaxID=1379734 RepID=A0ABR9Y9R7_9PROT|nr:hypothetical protein [Gluconobacter cerevisiae]MBF0875394.1 hypothetical protein [Gluconobacter cerevisiae]
MIFCNDFVSMNFSPKINNDGIRDNTIIVTISGIGHEHDSDKYILLEDDFSDFNLLGITSKKRDFFINNSTNIAIDFLKNFLGQFSEVIVITHSMGGFFGFYLNKYIDIDLCIVCSPYLSLSSEEMNLSNDDNRVLQDRISGFCIENYCINKIKVSNLELKRQENLIIIIDPILIDDKKTAHMVDTFFKKINVIMLPNCGHLSLYYLERSHVISSIIRNKIKTIDKLFVKKIISGVLTFYLRCVSFRSSKICIKSQIYFNDQELHKNYYSFVYDASCSDENNDHYIFINKYGCIMSFCLSKSGISWSSMPFEDGKFSAVIMNKHKNMCFSFYNEQFIEMDYKKVYLELNKSENEFSKIPFSRDFFTNYFNKLSFNEKIDLYSIINRNKKS